MNDFIINSKPIQIAITGPESTGKSQLASGLANYFGGNFVKEYAREYMNKLSGAYTRKDILTIARQQLGIMEAGLTSSKRGYLFYDTEFTVLRIWSEYKYGECDPWIVDRQQDQAFDLYLLAGIDLPWQPDPQREHPDNRQELFDLYEKELLRQGWDYEIVTGRGKERLENAIRFIKSRY